MDLLTSHDIFTDGVDEYERFMEEFSGISSSNAVGFFRRDVSVQTDESELPAVQILSETTFRFIQELDILKKDISLKLKFIRTQYESRLLHEAEGFYTKIYEKIQYVERHHEERIAVLRRSYQQQLNDAIAVVKANFKKYYARKTGNEEEIDPYDNSRLKQMTNEVAELNVKIEYMSEELREYKEKAEQEPEEDIEKKNLRSENVKLKDDIDTLHIEMERIQALLDSKDECLEQLVNEIHELQDKAVESKKAMRQVAALKEELDKEKQATEESHKNESHAVQQQSKDLHTIQEAALRVQQAEVNTPISGVHQVTPGVQVEKGTEELKEQINSLKKAEAARTMHIQRLQMQLTHNSKVWEKKFHIMRQSFYAIKDEMYIRQTLQRQAASLQVASVSYTMDTPLSPVNNGPRPPYNSIKTHLPNIRLQSVAGRNLSPDNRPTGKRATEDLCFTEPRLLESDEDEDDDDEYPGVRPLPPPPAHV